MDRQTVAVTILVRGIPDPLFAPAMYRNQPSSSSRPASMSSQTPSVTQSLRNAGSMGALTLLLGDVVMRSASWCSTVFTNSLAVSSCMNSDEDASRMDLSVLCTITTCSFLC